MAAFPIFAGSSKEPGLEDWLVISGDGGGVKADYGLHEDTPYGFSLSYPQNVPLVVQLSE